MQPEAPTLPELHLLGKQVVAAPERRSRHVVAIEARGGIGQPAFEFLSVGQRLALVARPRADLRLAWPRSEVVVGDARGHLRHATTDTDLAIELAPQDGERRARIDRRARGPCGWHGSCRRRIRRARRPAGARAVPRARPRRRRSRARSRWPSGMPAASASASHRRNCSIGSGSRSARRSAPCSWVPVGACIARGSVTGRIVRARLSGCAPGRIRTCAPGSGGRCSIP